MKTSVFTLILACLGALLLGASPVFVRISDLGPVTTGFYRMLFAMPFLFIWMASEKRAAISLFSKKGNVAIILAGSFFALDLALWNWSIDYTAIVNATLFNNTAAFFVPLLVWLLYQEKQSLRFIIGVVTGLFGCVLLFQESFYISMDNLVGDIVALISGLTVAFYVIAVTRVRASIGAGTLMFWLSFPTIIVLGLIALLMGENFGPLTWRDGVSIFGQAVLVHTLGQGLLAYAMGKIPASYSALIMLLAPVNAAFLGWLVYGEELSLMKCAGMVIVMMSILFVKDKKS